MIGQEISEHVFAAPLGDTEPRIGIRVRRAVGSTCKTGPASFVAQLSRSACLQELVGAFLGELKVPDGGVVLMYEGRTLALPGTLAENGVTLPGPAARRSGALVEISFDTVADVVEQVKTGERIAKERKTAEDAQERRQAELELRIIAREDEERHQTDNAEREFEEKIRNVIGTSQEQRASLLANPQALADWREQGRVDVQNHFLTPCSEEVRLAVEMLMSDTGVTGGKVLRAYQNENETLQRRYLRAREALLAGAGAGINRTESQTQAAIRKRTALDFMGPYEDVVNEYPMWHGTPNPEAAGGICGSGFDIAFAGAAHGLAWGHGFYFADVARVGDGYATGFGVNSKYNNCTVMLLCRVLCGQIKRLTAAPSTEDKERLTAECLGPGGTFGTKSECHSICGGGYAYVCAHRDQVYPAYVIVYARGARA